MAGKRAVLIVFALVSIAAAVWGGRLAGQVEGWLLALHGEPPAAAPTSQRDGWPDTPAGAAAAAWVQAYGEGEGAMQAYLEHHGC